MHPEQLQFNIIVRAAAWELIEMETMLARFYQIRSKQLLYFHCIVVFFFVEFDFDFASARIAQILTLYLCIICH